VIIRFPGGASCFVWAGRLGGGAADGVRSSSAIRPD
jgi:hypothetical protein